MSATRLTGFFNKLKSLRTDERGNVALMMGILLVPLVGAVGYGIDYTRAVSYRLKLDSAANAAALAGMDTARALLLSNPNMSPDSVKAAADARAIQVFAGLAPAEFPYILNDVTFNRVGETMSGAISYSVSFPTTFTNVIGVQNIAIDGGSTAQAPLVPPKDSEGNNNDPDYLIRERFDKTAVTVGSYRTSSRAYNNWAAGPGGWEIGTIEAYKTTPAPPGDVKYMMELDTHMNSSISRKIYLTAGEYQLRYYFINRVSYSAYEPITICGTKPVDVDWAFDASGKLFKNTLGSQSNRVGVYLHPARTDTPPEDFNDVNHNMIDVCVTSSGKWIERSVTLKMKSNGFYWLTFQGEGASDGFGGLIADVRLCRTACPGNVASTFPWSNNTVLFKDDLELPTNVVPADYIGQYQLNNSGAMTPESKWSSIPAGWTTSPINQVEFVKTSIAGKTTYVLPLDSSEGGGSNKAIHRKFLLQAGAIYRMKWNYSTASDRGAIGTWCNTYTQNGYADAMSQINVLKSDSKPEDTNLIRFYVDADRFRLHPEHATTLGAPVIWRTNLGTWVNWNRIPFQPVDWCLHSSSPSNRTSLFQIVKTGYYWLSFRAEGTPDGLGARLDNISLEVHNTNPNWSNYLWIPIAWPEAAFPGAALYQSNGNFEVIQQ